MKDESFHNYRIQAPPGGSIQLKMESTSREVKVLQNGVRFRALVLELFWKWGRSQRPLWADLLRIP